MHTPVDLAKAALREHGKTAAAVQSVEVKVAAQLAKLAKLAKQATFWLMQHMPTQPLSNRRVHPTRHHTTCMYSMTRPMTNYIHKHALLNQTVFPHTPPCPAAVPAPGWEWG
jgi:hypothetical protein